MLQPDFALQEEKFDSGKKWPPILDTDDLPKKRLPSIYKAPTPEMIAYLDFSVSTTGMLAGIKMSHGAATSLCLSMKVCHFLSTLTMVNDTSFPCSHHIFIDSFH